MDKLSLYAAQFLTFKEYFAKKGHKACPGCGVSLSARHVYKALGEDAQYLEKAKWQIPWIPQLILKTDTCSDTTQTALLSVPKNNKGTGNTLHICFDNECTANKIKNSGLIKKLPVIAEASGYSYVATACPSHPFDLAEKITKAWEVDGDSYIHILCPCPVAWGFNMEDTVRLGRMAVESKLFPLYEISKGYYRLTISDELNPRPVKDYIKKQDRFSKWNLKQIQTLQDEIESSSKKLTAKINTEI